MAIYRQVQTAYWQDEFVLQLTPEERYFYIYLLTNSKTKQCGIYQLPMQVIIMETGYNQETSEKLLKRFVEYGKIICSMKSREIGILNWPRYNPMESPKTRACVEKELKEVKDKSLIGVIYPDRYPIQGASQEEKEEEKEKAEAEAEAEEEELKVNNYKLKIGGEENQERLTSTAAAAGELFSDGNKNNNPPPTATPFFKGELGNKNPTDMKTPLDKGELKNNYPTDLKTPLDKGEARNDDYGDYKCKSIQMQAELLLIRLWNKQKPNPEEVRITAEYIKKFGQSEVETVFTEAVKYDRKKLAYVETVCKRRKERADLLRKNILDRQKRIEQEKKLEEERKSGVGLGLIKYLDESKEYVKSKE